MSGDTHLPEYETPAGEITLVRPKKAPSNAPFRSNIGDDIRSEFFRKTRQQQIDNDKYLLREKIAQGGMGSIHEAYDKSLQRSSALKIILPKIQEDPQLFQQFIKEAQITAKLEHPNIIPVHDIGVLDEDRLHFSMKQVQGDSLGRIVWELRQETEDYVQRYSQYNLLIIFRKICDAVAFAHSMNILHRDIKPDNIMVGDFGEVLLMDWGLARPTDQKNDPLEGTARDQNDQFSKDQISKEEYSKEGEITLHGIVKGSPAFMSPEQAKGESNEIDHRSDIFLLGSTLYSLATLQAPYTGESVKEILANAKQGNFIAPQLRVPDRQIQPEVCRIIRKAMALNPLDRYQSVGDLCKDLDALLEGSTPSNIKTFAGGEIIANEGEAGDEAYVIVRGTVEIFKATSSGDMRLSTLGKGNVIGEMALITNSVRTASIRAIEQTELVIITKQIMDHGLSQLPSWLSATVNCLTDRLNTANNQVHPLIGGDCTRHVLSQLNYIYFYWSEEKTDNFSQGKILSANIQTVASEIANNLCIPLEKVENIFSHLLTHGVIRPVETEEFRIANFNLFNSLLQRAGAESHDHNLSRSRNSYAQSFYSNSIEEITGISDETLLNEKLDQILSKIRG